MVAWMVTVWVMGAVVVEFWLEPTAVKVMGKVPVVMEMKWSGPQAVVAVVRSASRARATMARCRVRRLRVRPSSERSVRGKSAASTTVVLVRTAARGL